jgi:opacity protein-like surface antigen
MRRHLLAAGLGALLVGLPAAASAQGQANAFGGLTFGDVTNSSTFGGSIGVPLSDNLQIIAEAGRMTDLMPGLVTTLLDVTPLDMKVSAWYGEAGVRVLGPSHRAVRPYAEATAGYAKLSAGFGGINATVDAIANTALDLFNRNEPMLGVGGGVLLQGGPLVVDLGYRYKKLYVGDSLQGLLTGGDVSVSQARVGVGFRF